ncbi:hypothetical protein CHLNCDRAFT_141242 [Chlorella variabilis]|uniref:Uncharacterized protein n=1 Tax=Chlorella variabilis TaxID=554065 RepID=E1ZSE9_CHLVA|nr:hypothetical protein CHLNCDRAFT_141242 [Chlorella variabilis]EFN51297.1 hypothetical protein CHLNCDRAFT_141242 [Chlorella variabilis]|eukprot:XP_005843399.1 hypothetical protein CHLNCDRAFT_141242 [Chlorella variabilis]
MLPMDSEAREELPKWLTLAGLAASQLSKQFNLTRFQLTTSHIYVALAGYTVAWAALTMLDRDSRVQFDVVGSAIGPMFVAVHALGGFGGRVAPMDVATFLFGWWWIGKLPAFPYSHWAWLATLVAAIYKGLGAQWLVGALGVSAVWRLVMDRDLKQLAFAGVAAYAFAKGAEVPVALIMMAAQMVASIVS